MQVPVLVKEFRKLVFTSLSVNQLLDLICMIEVSGDFAEMIEIPESMLRDGPGETLIPDKKGISGFLAEELGGIP